MADLKPTGERAGEDTGAVFALDGRFIFFLPRKSPFDIGEFARFCPHDLGTGQDTPIAPEPDLSVAQLRVAPDGKWL